MSLGRRTAIAGTRTLHPTRQEALLEHYATDAGPLPVRSYAADKPHASHLSWHVTSWHYRLPPTPTPHSLLLFWLHWSYNLSPCFARYCITILAFVMIYKAADAQTMKALDGWRWYGILPCGSRLRGRNRLMKWLWGTTRDWLGAAGNAVCWVMGVITRWSFGMVWWLWSCNIHDYIYLGKHNVMRLNLVWVNLTLCCTTTVGLGKTHIILYNYLDLGKSDIILPVKSG